MRGVVPGDRLPVLDAVRGAAVLLVLLYHGFYWAVPAGVGPLGVWPLYQAARAGWLGVQLFFVLSGFLITGILLDARAQPGFWTRFWTRRARRILPALLLLLAVLWASGQIRPAYLLASLLFAANVSPWFGVPRDYPPLWSLAVEEQFYLLWPFVVRWASPRTLAWACVGLIAGAPVLRGLAFARGDTDALYYHTWHNTDALAAGALLAVVLRHPRATAARVRGIARYLALALGLLIVAALFAGWLTTRAVADTAGDAVVRNTIWSLWCAAVMGLLIASGDEPGKGTRRVPGLEFLGHISYGLYLVQLLAFRAFDAWVAPPAGAGFGFMLLRFVAAGGSAVAVATLSRWTLEEWFLRGSGSTVGAGHADGSLGRGQTRRDAKIPRKR